MLGYQHGVSSSVVFEGSLADKCMACLLQSGPHNSVRQPQRHASSCSNTYTSKREAAAQQILRNYSVNGNAA